MQHPVKYIWQLGQREYAALERAVGAEAEQAIKIRLTIALIVAVFFCFPWQRGQSFSESFFSPASYVTLGFLLGSILIVIAIMKQRRPSVLRRIAGICLDLVSLSVLMYFSGEKSIYLFALYLWTILGNGFRYGMPYLYFSLLVGLTGFSITITWGDYWQDTHHQPIALSLLFLMILIPLYASFLIRKLHAAIASAKEANEAKSRFLANMSHELRTPLNGVIGIAELLRETQLDRQQQDYVQIMKRSAHSLLGLIENVLDISKIEAGKMVMATETFDLHQWLMSLVKIQGTLGKEKGLHIACYIDARVPFLLQGDPQHLRQVIVNLMGNAIKFTQSGWVKLSVTLADNDPETALRLRFEVQDTGMGIPEAALASIFDDFVQVPGAQQTQTGTGLGTTIAKELVERMGGEIGVESQEGVGTLFWFELPFVPVEDEDSRLKNTQILILASTTLERQLSPILSGWGITYDHVTSTARAFSHLMGAIERDTPYQIMLVDQACMGDIDPVRFAQMIRTEPALDSLALVLLDLRQGIVTQPEQHHYYLSEVTDLADKRWLFNAIHAAQSVDVDDDKVVSLAEHYAKQAQDRPLKVLIAEDNKVNQQVLEGILSQVGHHCLLAETGEQALDILTENLDEIDLLILDKNMPEMSGLEVVKAMQYLDTAHSIPIIMLTADATLQAKQASLDSGVDAFLTKPINAKVLLDTVVRLAAGAVPQCQTQHTVPKPAAVDWYDPSVLDTLSELGGVAFLQRLIQGFKTDGEQHIAQMKQEGQQDYLALREHLHALKGAATELGASRLAQLCLDGEQLQPYDVDTPEGRALIRQVEDAFNHTLVALEHALIEMETAQSVPQN